MTQSTRGVPSASTFAGARPSLRIAGFAAGILWSVGILIPNILAIVFQATQQSRGIGESELGTLGAAFILGRGIIIATSPFWVYRSNPRRVSTGSLFATVAALLAVAFLVDTAHLSYGWFLVGLTSGCVSAPAYTALGNARDPLRAYSIALFGSSLIGAIVAYLLPSFIVPHWGERGALIAIAACFLAMVPFAWALRDAQFVGSHVERQQKHVHSGRPVWRRLAPPIIAAVAGALFTGVVMGGVSAFVASIAVSNGIEAKSVGLMVALALIASLAGALVPSAVRDRIAPVTMIGLSIGGIIASYAAMTSHSAVLFGAGFIGHAVFATTGYVYFLGVVRSLDFTDRIYVAYPAMDSAAFAASAELFGSLLSRSPPSMLFLISGGVLILCWLAAVAASRMAARTGGSPPEHIAGGTAPPSQPSQSDDVPAPAAFQGH